MKQLHRLAKDGGDAESTQTDTANAGSSSVIDTSDTPSHEDHGEASGSK
jgi:hypothetical protein